MNWDTINAVLAELPGYAEVTATDDRGRTFNLMARDMPRPGRRFTCTTTGTEWFLMPEGWANVESITFDRGPLTLTVTR